MKRAITAALFSGLVVLAVPGAAFAQPAPDHGDCAGRTEQSAGSGQDCAAHPEGADSPDGRRAPDDSRRHDGDDDDGSFILF